jgi:hypothetical protein
MWIVEVNFAGHRFTRRVGRPPSFRFSPRVMSWRPSQLRNQHAA